MAKKFQYILDFEAQTAKFNKDLGGLKSGIKSVGMAAAAYFSVDAILDFGKAAVAAYDDSVKAETALLVALKGRADVQQRLIGQATELMDKTLFDDDEIVRAQSLVAAFVKEEASIKTLIPLIQDMATAKQMDLAGAADLVTKTLAGEMNALGRYGIKVEGAAGSAERLASIQNGLNNAFGGQAEAAAKVGTAALTQLSNQYGNLLEVVGKLTISQQNQEGSFTKILTNATKGVTSFLGKVATWSDAGFSFSESLVAAFANSDEDTAKLAESMVVASTETAAAASSMTGAGDAAKYQAGSVGALGEELTKLNEKLANTNASDIKSIQLIGQKIAALEKQKAAIESISSDPISFRTDKLGALPTAQVTGKLKVTGSDQPFDVKAKLNVDEVLDNMPVFKEAMEDVNDYQDMLIEKQAAVQGAFESGFQKIGQSVVDGLGLAETGFEGFLGGLASTVVELVSMFLAQSLASAIAGATTSGAATGPAAIITTPAFIATAIAGVLGAFATIPALADGGIAYGRTTALIGEYPGASSNPEVIAPLSKLKSIIGGSNQQIILQPSVEMSGDKFRVMINRVESNKRKRTG